MSRHALVLTALAVALGLAAGRAQAQDAASPSPAAPASATIVRIDGGDFVLDVGAAALGEARTLTVYRRVVVRHPLTRKALEDRFAIGELQVVQTGETLSLAHEVGASSRPFAIGDRAELHASANARSTAAQPAPSASTAAASSAAVDTQAPTPSSAAATPSASATAAVTITQSSTGASALDAQAADLLRYHEATLGQAPEHRARIYRTYLERNPQSRYRTLIEQEIRYLRALQRAESEHAHNASEARRDALLASAIELLPPDYAPRERALELAARVRPEAEVRGLVLHLRGPGEKVYRSLSFTLDGHGHARVGIPAALMQAPEVAFFVEAVDQRGKTATTFASAKAPHVIRVPKPLEVAGARRDPVMRVHWSSEIASFDGTSGRDYFLINEGDFFYRIGYGHLYGIRMGYGRFDGEGGTVEQLDVLRLDPAPAGFTYAYFEGELTLTELLGVAVRGTLGLGRPDAEETDQADGEITGGFQARLRIGDPNATNLVIGGELLPEIGQRALLHFGWELIDRVPMAAEVQVTDQPVNSDELAVRIVYELGYRLTDRVALALRPSYQLRTIRHAGPGLGLSATFDW